MTQATAETTSWRSVLRGLRREPTNSRILGGSLLMLIGSGLVSAINFAYNVAVARMLGPASFGHAAAAVTLLMLLSAITLAFQLVCAKFIALNETPAAKAAVYQTLLRRSWYVGLTLGSFLAFASREVAAYLNLPSGELVIILAVGIAFYIPLGVKRGGLQGTCAFSRLTLNFILETSVKFCGAITAIQVGFGVNGAVGAISASVIAAYFVPPITSELRVAPMGDIPASFREGMQAIVFFVGQVVINNIDILLVKHFFEPAQAGVYAAVALVGRVVYMLSWSVVSAMFPISAGTKHRDDNRSVLVVPLLLVLGIAVTFTAGLTLFPEFAVRAIFGAGYQARAHVESLLPLYAAATGLYSLSVVLMAYEMSRKIANSGWIQLAFSGAIFAGIHLFHSDLHDVVVVQLVLMVLLLITSSVPFFRAIAPERPTLEVAVPGTVTSGAVQRLRRVPEAEVIAAFLRNEYYHREFDRDRERFREIVMNPDTSDEFENRLRRALLFRRRATMWHELPLDTQWWEVKLTPAALDHIDVFPRAQWRKMARGNFKLVDLVARIQSAQPRNRTRTFVQKLAALSSYLSRNHDDSTILLISVDDNNAMTLIEGNHRMTAAMMAGPDVALRQFRYVCGFSPNMRECCWYRTNVVNLSRYAIKRVRLMVHNVERDIERLLASHPDTEQGHEESAARKTA